jgi:hypothetical protein
MWNIRIRKSSAATRSKPGAGRSRLGRLSRLGERGQVMLEYLLIIAVVFSIFIFLARPYLKSLNKKFEEAGKSGFFAEDPSGSNFYYFPIR